MATLLKLSQAQRFRLTPLTLMGLLPCGFLGMSRDESQEDTEGVAGRTRWPKPAMQAPTPTYNPSGKAGITVSPVPFPWFPSGNSLGRWDDIAQPVLPSRTDPTRQWR